MRINKYLAKSGLASRRASEKYILEGRVKVNGIVLENLAYRVQAEDVITVDDNVVHLEEELVYFMLNKPVGYVSTQKDPFAKKIIFDLIDEKTRLFSIGRLDKDSRGLLLLTNDGQLYQHLMHPSQQIFKHYQVRLNKEFKLEHKSILENGIDIGDYITNPAKIRVQDDKKDVIISISEGKNRQVRRMFAALTYQVVDLNRLAIEDLKLGSLSQGDYRPLTQDEVEYLYNL